MREGIETERHRLAGLAALAAYTLVSFLFLGLAPLLQSNRFIGVGYDPQIFIWGFAWWPHAILHGENPFVTHAVWYPPGVDLAWTTTVPGLALLLAPVTWTFGPIVSYGVASVLMPALAAWAAYLLCRYLTGKLWPSVFGGYLFGFSSYVLAAGGYGGHLHLSSVFVLPLAALLVLRFLDGSLGGRGLVWRLGPLLALQLLCATEVAFTLTLAGAVALALAFAFFPARRTRIVRLLPPVAGAYLVGGIITAPFLYYLLAHLRAPFYQLGSDSLDLVNFVIPTRLTALGGDQLTSISNRFPVNISEQGAYFGLPLLVIVFLYVRERWKTAVGRLLLLLLALALLISLGAQLVVDGHAIVELPWKLLESLPVIDNTFPTRFIVYVALLIAVMAAMWAASARPGALRIVLPVLAVVALVPWPGSHGFTTLYHVPSFFTDSAYQSCLDPGEVVLPLPYRTGNALLWQAESGFRFDMAGGDLGPDIPSVFERPSGVPFLAQEPLGVNDAGVLRTFLQGKGVTSIVVDANDANSYAGAVDQVAAPQVVGGVYLYHLTPDAPSCPG